MKIVFFGSGKFSLPVLKYLIGFRREDLLAVVTQPDRKAGRKLELKPTPVKEYLIRYSPGIRLFQPENVNQQDLIKEIELFKPNLFLVCSFGQILGSRLLSLPSKFALNLHASLLPKYRGAAPVNWAIINGERVTGVSIFKMEAGLDRGEIAVQKSCQIEPEDDALSLEEKLSQLAVELLQEVLEKLDKNSLKFRPQEGEVSYAPKLKKEDGLLDWNWDAEQIQNRVRGLQPWPCAFSYLRGELFKIYSAKVIQSQAGSPGEIIFLNKESLLVKCGQDALSLLEVQLAGKRRMRIKEFLAGHNLELGERLGT